jgi:taurine dioxygenase
MITSNSIEVRRVAGALGAEISGADLSNGINDTAFAAIHDAFLEHGVIFFRDQALTPEQHLAFARRLGEIDVNKFFPTVEGYPEIAEVRKEPQDSRNIGGGWHTDHSYDAEPAKASMLYALELPDYGGDTLFASMYAAYDALSDGMKRLLGRLNAVHSGRRAFGTDTTASDEGLTAKFKRSEIAHAEVVHPVVVSHPETGRELLYVNPGFTVRFEDMTEEESRPLLDYLYQHAARPEFTCRFRWRPGSVALWDNRSTHHFAVNDYSGQRRLMRRVTIQGGPLGP